MKGCTSHDDLDDADGALEALVAHDSSNPKAAVRI